MIYKSSKLLLSKSKTFSTVAANTIHITFVDQDVCDLFTEYCNNSSKVIE